MTEEKSVILIRNYSAACDVIDALETYICDPDDGWDLVERRLLEFKRICRGLD